MGASFAVVDAVRHRRSTADGAPRVARKFSTAAASSPPPHEGLLPIRASEFATFIPTLPPLRSAATAQQLRARPRRRPAGPPQSLRGSRRRGRIAVSFHLTRKRMPVLGILFFLLRNIYSINALFFKSRKFRPRRR